MANTFIYSQLWTAQQIADTEDDIYTASTDTTTGVVKNISAVICNVTGSDVNVEVWIEPSGGAAGNSNKLINSEPVPANGRLSFGIPDMSPGQTLVAKASTASALTIHCLSGTIIN